MLNDQDLARLNELARKKKLQSLTDSELTEQTQLRQKYLNNFRRSMSGQIETIKVVDIDGNDITSDKVKRIQKEKGIHDRNEEQ